MKIKRLFGLTIALSIVLAIAAFGSDGLKNLFTSKINPAQAAESSANMPVVLLDGNIDPGSQTSYAVQFVPAPELPTRAPDVAGAIAVRDGSTLTLQSSFIVTTDMKDGAVFGGSALGTISGDSLQSGVIIVSGSTSSSVDGSQPELAQPEAVSDPVDLQGIIVIGSGDQVLSAVVPSSAVSSGSVPAAPGEAIPADLTDLNMPFQAAPHKVVVTDATKIYQDVTPMGQLPADGNQTIQQVLETVSLDALTGQMMVTVWGHMDGEQFIADVIVYQNQFLK
jgi:hypothetical protein